MVGLPVMAKHMAGSRVLQCRERPFARPKTILHKAENHGRARWRLLQAWREAIARVLAMAACFPACPDSLLIFR